MPAPGLLTLLTPWLLLIAAGLLGRTLTPSTAALTGLLSLAGLTPAAAGLLVLAGLILGPTLARALALAWLTLPLTGTRSPGLTLAGLAMLSRLSVLSRLAGLRASRLLSPTAATLLRRLPLVRGLLRLLRALAPTATLAGRLLTPAALTPLSLLLPALAPRLPRTPRSLRRRRHICSF